MNTKVSVKKTADWHPSDIKAALEKKGWNYRKLAQACGYKSGSSLRNAIDRSYPKAERIIAHAIGVLPEDIWPTRYAKRNFTPVFTQSPFFPHSNNKLTERGES